MERLNAKPASDKAPERSGWIVKLVTAEITRHVGDTKAEAFGVVPFNWLPSPPENAGVLPQTSPVTNFTLDGVAANANARRNGRAPSTAVQTVSINEGTVAGAKGALTLALNL